MKKVITTLILTCCIASLFACSCGFVPFGVEKIIGSDLFVKGTITEKINISIEEGKDVPIIKDREIGIYKYTLKVDEYIKGSGESTIYFYSNMSSSACGVNYAIDSKMYVFTYKNKSRNYTSSCSGNFRTEKGDEKSFKTILDAYKKSTTSQKWKNETGVIEAEGQVINQIPTGTWKFYHEDGSLNSIGKFKDGKRKGKWKSYHNDGSLGNVGKYKKGKKKGKWKYYLDKKSVQELITKKGAAVKSKKGKILQFTTKYKNGEVVDTKYFTND